MGNSRKYRGKTGYTLHAKRIEYSGQSKALRTIKFPLITNSGVLFSALHDRVQHDHLYLTGSTNIDDWINHGEIYSLVDFWVDALRLGGFFQPDAKSMGRLLDLMEGRNTIYIQMVETMPTSLRRQIDTHQLINDLLKTTGFRKSSSPERIFARVVQAFKEEYRESQIARQTASIISKGVFEKDYGEEQVRFIAQAFKMKYIADDRSLTFFLNPYLEVDQESSPALLVRMLEDYFTPYIEDGITNLDDLLGYGNEANAYGNFLGQVVPLLQAGKVGEIVDAFGKHSALWLGRERELRQRLQYLAERAQRFHKPLLVNSWADYRSVFGGKLQSWYSNYKRHMLQVRERLELQKPEFERVEFEINKALRENDDRYLRETKAAVEELGKILEALLEKYQIGGETIYEDDLMMYRDLLGQLRVRINSLWQRRRIFKDKKDGSESKPIHKQLRAIFRNMRVVPSFFGRSKFERNRRFLDSVRRLEEGFAILAVLRDRMLAKPLDWEGVDDKYLCRQLDTMARMYRRGGTNLFTSKLTKILVDYGGKVPGERERFYVSPYSRERFHLVAPAGRKKLVPEALVDWWEELKFKGNWKSITDKQLVDLLEIEKVRMGWLLRLHPDDEWKLDDLRPKYFEKARSLIEINNGRLSSWQFGQFVQAFILGEMRGTASLMTRRRFAVHHVVQPLESEKKFVLQAVFKNGETNEFGPGEQYVFAVTVPRLETGVPAEESGLTSDYVVPIREKEVSNKEALCRNGGPKKLTDTFRIGGSRYQRQFLEWFVMPHRKKGRVSLKRSEPMVVAETDYLSVWDKTSGGVKLTPRARRLFYNQPFAFTPRGLDTMIDHLPGRYLGVDIGEYGIAFAVIQVQEEDGKVELIDRGFFFDRAVRKIRDRVNELRKRQMTGTFAIPDTAVARVRENAIHTLRNRIHDLVLRYKAKPIYEFEVSAFEVGSGRVRKIYHSVKRSDVPSDIKADGLERKAIWGNQYKDGLVGNHIGAYATSQTCSRCRRSVLDWVDREVNYRVEIDPRTRRGKVWLSDGVKIEIFVDDSVDPDEVTKISGKEVNKYAYKFMRPPKDSPFLENRGVAVSEAFKQHRGNQAIFVCPFFDCHHISDADIQAAVHIAFKGYLKDKEKRNKTRYDFFDELGNLSLYPEVGFDDSLF
jgi:hypothetical protein